MVYVQEMSYAQKGVSVSGSADHELEKKLEKKLETLKQELEKKLEVLERRMETKLEALEHRIEALEKNVNDKFAAIMVAITDLRYTQLLDTEVQFRVTSCTPCSTQARMGYIF